MFTLAISCLITSNLPWFMNLTFLVPMQYFSLQHWTLLSPPDTFTSVCSFCFGSASSFFLEVFLCSPPVAYWTPSDLGAHLPSFCLFTLFMGFSRQKYWSGLHFLLQWAMFCQNSPLWPVHLGWSWTAWLIASLNLHKAVIHVIILVSFLWLWYPFWRPWDCSSDFFCLRSGGGG